MEGEEAAIESSWVRTFMYRLVSATQSIMFNGESFQDWQGGKLLLGPNGAFDADAQF
jgi:hypothetical protein